MIRRIRPGWTRSRRQRLADVVFKLADFLGLTDCEGSR